MIRSSSRAGAHHEFSPLKNQDAVCASEDNHFAVITLADGVSTCRMARSGAQISASSVTELWATNGSRFMDLKHEEVAGFLLDQARYEIRKAAEADKNAMQEYASTLSSVCLDKSSGRLMYFNLGDAIIVGCTPYQFKILASPADSYFGCPVTTTASALKSVKSGVLDTVFYEQVLIFSDGAWRSILKKGTLDSEAMGILQRMDYDAFESYLEQKNIHDDYSFIAMSLA